MKKQKAKRNKCDLCGKPAAKRVPSIRMKFCRACSEQLDIALEKEGIATALMPFGLSESQKTAFQLKNVLRSQKKDRVVVWIARTKEEYERGKELDLIRGWGSWERYEHHFAEFFRSCDFEVHNVETTPDEIVAELEQLGLPNDPDGRAQLFLRKVGEQ